ncbi:hypothetical protein INT44_009374 [Umbelopsis vinacea]|uniref:Uncharacterized protein n=1 Tax=Umbelopsis vinacea TaxID=44442 RepID=A0A8H7UML5_9FUNG|nr:hypothetical protein INT44_009374 [Umbelopsis vinacea]
MFQISNFSGFSFKSKRRSLSRSSSVSSSSSKDSIGSTERKLCFSRVVIVNSSSTFVIVDDATKRGVSKSKIPHLLGRNQWD